MKVRFLALFLLIAGTQALSTSQFNMNLTSEGKGLIQSNELLGKLYGGIEDSIRFEKTKNGQKQELFNTARKAQGGSSRGGGNKGKAGNGGSADVNRRPRPNLAPSLLSRPHFWVSIFNVYVSLALIILFPFHYI